MKLEQSNIASDANAPVATADFPGEPGTAPSFQQRLEHGRAARKMVPRGGHAAWSPGPGRPDPMDLLEAQAEDRLPDLAPIRYARMLASPFTFMRGSAIIMANDLARTPTTGIHAQLCGDAHLLNFGMYASPERALLFDLNDFDETLPGPWEWDLKRLAASLVVAGRDNGFGAGDCGEAARASATSYRERMAEFAQMGELEVWYSHVSEEEAFGLISGSKTMKKARKAARKARGRHSLQALSRLTRVDEDGRRVIDDDPPLLVRVSDLGQREQVQELLRGYRSTLPDDRRHLLDRYRFVDVARKVVGIGSVGTRAFAVLLEGRDGDDPLFLQVKEATASVLEGHAPPSAYKNHGHRVVAGQRVMQAASDIFLGWLRGPAGRDFYWRQLRDMKGSAKPEGMTPGELVIYARLCGWALARAHARSGDRVRISGYLGGGERFDKAIAEFSQSYADQNERDYESLRAAAKSGRIEVAEGA